MKEYDIEKLLVDEWYEGLVFISSQWYGFLLRRLQREGLLKM